MTPSILVRGYQDFGGIDCFHIWGTNFRGVIVCAGKVKVLEYTRSLGHRLEV